MKTRTDIAAPKVNYPHGELTEPMVRNANYKLKKKYGKPKGSARKSRKGKQRAGPARSTPYFRASTAETSETDVTYQTEVSFPGPGSGNFAMR